MQTGGEVAQQAGLPFWILALGGVGIVVGLATMGYRVMRTIGKRITELTPTRGYAATLAAAITVVVASKTGLPVSTTQIAVGCVMGVGLARGVADFERTGQHEPQTVGVEAANLVQVVGDQRRGMELQRQGVLGPRLGRQGILRLTPEDRRRRHEERKDEDEAASHGTNSSFDRKVQSVNSGWRAFTLSITRMRFSVGFMNGFQLK